MADVRFEHVYKRYGDNPPVITDLNLEIADREFLVLVGPSGCGKSTALRMIAGLEDISEGNLYIGDRLVNDVAPKDRDIAMVFQNYALYPHMTVFDNMAFALTLRHTPKEEIQQRVERAAQMLGITLYLKRRPRELSGGQRQRVALGRALVRDPQVFLLDEPLSNLDAKLRVATRTEISRLHQATGTTFVYVTHDQVEAMTMGDRIAVLNAGIIQQLGTPQELYEHPANLFVAGFIGSPSMDFFEVNLHRKSDGHAEIVVGKGDDAQRLTLQGQAAEVATGQAPGAGDTSEGRPLIVGIRPEHFSLDGAQSGDGATISGVVDVVEHLGNEQLVYLRLPGAYVPEASETKGSTARVGANAKVSPGERISLRVDTSHLHFFDPSSTKSLV
ncbi:MAG TPA: sn-glycerol-3-phosphate ABC transporter ATP-binding protein UgpC [Ktedonobacterales bacterium]|nr:sn-glycerol-3-phosphate ABC transporter ATP-binding protein UgpC [Ktedonobacterales bacterium]